MSFITLEHEDWLVCGVWDHNEAVMYRLLSALDSNSSTERLLGDGQPEPNNEILLLLAP